jgi:hypothetical protein
MNGYFWYINNTWFIHDTGCVLGCYMCVTMITIIYVYIYKSEHVSLRFHNHDYNIQASSWNNNVVHCLLFIDNSSNVSFNNRGWFRYVRCDFVTWFFDRFLLLMFFILKLLLFITQVAFKQCQPERVLARELNFQNFFI